MYSSSENKEIILKARNLLKIFGTGKDSVIAVDHINFDIHKGEIVSLVGQSGSGKTTTAQMLLNLIKPTEGNIELNGIDIRTFQGRNRIKYWQKVQGIFQDPFSSFNQFFSISKILKDSLKILGSNLKSGEKDKLITESLESVNINPKDVLDKYPFELSGGQRQRIMIARIFLIKPQLLIADEPTSMIDAVLRSNILKLFMKLREVYGTSIIFVTHDIGLAYYVSDRVFIMQHGKIVESGDPEKVIINPQHPYTIKLINDVPILHQQWEFKLS